VVRYIMNAIKKVTRFLSRTTIEAVIFSVVFYLVFFFLQAT